MGGGNFAITKSLTKSEIQFKVLKTLGAGMCRIPVHAGIYWSRHDNKTYPQKCDELIILARQYDVQPVLLFEYYTRWNGELGGKKKWHAIGRAFAERFRPNSEFLKSKGITDWGIVHYTAINEPMWRQNNPKPIDPQDYAAAMEGLADGVHSVDPKLRVSPGGYQEMPLFANRNVYIKSVSRLYNSGKLWAIDIHRYWDVEYVPMAGSYKRSLQSQFEMVKRDASIKADVKFHTTEMNFKKRKISEDEAAKGFLTALWDALCVVGKDGRRVTQFVMPWNIFHLSKKDDHYGMCTEIDPWTPLQRGRVLRMVCRITKGMEFVSCDPKGRGVHVLEGDRRKLWVWQNRKAWSACAGTSFVLDSVPKDARRIEVYRYNSWDGPCRSIKATGAKEYRIEDLEEEETYMFLAVEG
jgi:hypothetical protein